MAMELGKNKKNDARAVLGGYVPRDGKRINVQHTLEQLFKKVPLNS